MSALRLTGVLPYFRTPGVAFEAQAQRMAHCVARLAGARQT
jgi:hypothetical protein